MRRRTLARILWFALICWACGILWISSLTPQELPDAAYLFWDKINHLTAFAVGGWLAASALRLSSPSAAVAGRIVIAVILIAAFGAVDESVQAFTPGRTGSDIYDWTADLLGAVVGAILSLATQERIERFLSCTANRP